jgi:hypothetical protein
VPGGGRPYTVRAPPRTAAPPGAPFHAINRLHRRLPHIPSAASTPSDGSRRA